MRIGRPSTQIYTIRIRIQHTHTKCWRVLSLFLSFLASWFQFYTARSKNVDHQKKTEKELNFFWSFFPSYFIIIIFFSKLSNLNCDRCCCCYIVLQSSLYIYIRIIKKQFLSLTSWLIISRTMTAPKVELKNSSSIPVWARCGPSDTQSANHLYVVTNPFDIHPG